MSQGFPKTKLVYKLCLLILLGVCDLISYDFVCFLTNIRRSYWSKLINQWNTHIYVPSDHKRFSHSYFIMGKIVAASIRKFTFKNIKMKWKCHKTQTYPSLFALSSHFSLTDCNNLKSSLFPLISLHFLCRATMEEEIFCHKNTVWTTNHVKDDSNNCCHYLWWWDEKAWFQIGLDQDWTTV